MRLEPLENRSLLATFSVTNTADSGAGTLRQAINDANGSAGLDTITFGVTGTIKPLTPLPYLNQATIVDGTTMSNYAGKPKVEIDGSLAGSADGLVLAGGNSSVTGLAINNFSGAGLVVASSDNVIRANFLGTDLSGTAAKGNGIGLLLTPHVDFGDVTRNTIGGNAVGHRNLISGNAGHGILIAGAYENTVQGNYIGVDFSGTAAIPNTGNGITIDRFSPVVFSAVPVKAGQGNKIGGIVAGEGNRIRSNGGAGVGVVSDYEAPIFNAIRGNSILGNGGLGIDLAVDGVTQNDDQDVDSGPNLLQNFPLVGGASITASSISTGGILMSRPNTTYNIDAFASPSADSSGHGEGMTYLGSTTVITGGNGIGSWAMSANVSIPAGYVVTATATDPNGNTSEFGNAAAIPVVGSPAKVQFYEAAPHSRENDGDAELLVTRTGNLSATTTVKLATTNDTAVAGSDYSSRNLTITFNPNESFKVVSIPLVNDAIYEGIERFDATLSNPTNGQVGSPNVAEVVIEDDDVFDARFSGDGRNAITTYGTQSDITAVTAVQSDGKILIAGNSGSRIAITRLKTDGSLDTSFGNDGRVATQVYSGANPDDILRGMIVQSDGKIVVVGYTGNQNDSRKDTLVIRYNANGTLDSTFGVGGIFKYDFSPDFSAEIGTAVLQQADGKLLIAGTGNEDFYLARLNAGGTLDTTFQATGVTYVHPGGGSFVINTPEALLRQANGKLVLVGTSGGTADNGQVAVARFNADGSLDTTYSSDGKEVFAIGQSVARAALDSQGRLVILGSDVDASFYSHLMLVRVTTTGALDTSFSGDGEALSGSLYDGAGMVVLAGDKLLVTGSATEGLTVQRFNANGSTDTTFSGDSRQVVPFSSGANAADLALDASGKVLVGVTSYLNQNDFGMARLNAADGALDTTFSGDGKQTVGFTGPLQNRVDSVVVQPDGKTVVSGTNGLPGSYNYGLTTDVTRFNTNGTLDTSFGTNGRAVIDTGSSGQSQSHDLALLSSGKLIAVADVSQGLGVVRLNANGTKDTTFGTNGLAMIQASDVFELKGASVVVNSTDGKITVAGIGEGTLVFARFNSNGTPDTSFGGDGVVITTIPVNELDDVLQVDLALMADGRYVVANSYPDPNDGGSRGMVARLNANGSLDTSFNGNGMKTINLGESYDTVNALALYTDGRILIGGGTSLKSGGGAQLLLARLTPAGAYDTAFDGDGKLTANFIDGPNGSSLVHALQIDSNGRIALVGQFFNFDTGHPSFVVQRRLSNGTLDTAFSATGTAVVAFGSDTDSSGTAMALTSNAIVAVGVSNNDIAVARMLVSPDPGPFAVVQLANTAYTFNEGGGTLTITVNRAGDTSVAANVGWSVSGISATVGVDLPNIGGTLNFAAGQTSRTINIPVINDALDEINEVFRVSLNNASGTTQIGAKQNAQVTITDNDPTPTISVNDVSIVEGDSGTKDLVFTLTLSAVSGLNVSVNYKTTADTATSPGDFTGIGSTKIAFTPGQTTKTVTVKIKGDTESEATEKFFLDLLTPTNATIADSRGIGTINDNDPAGIGALDAVFGQY